MPRMVQCALIQVFNARHPGSPREIQESMLQSREVRDGRRFFRNRRSELCAEITGLRP